MDYNGKAIRLSEKSPGIAELCFDLQGESVNKFNQLTLTELSEAIALLEGAKDLKGLLITSAKGVFIVGADIFEFKSTFALPEDELRGWVGKAQAIFNRLEDLPFPSVALINGVALGGGMEAVLAATFRVMSDKAILGQPEVKLGIIPGFGGTVRLPRLIGVDNALELITSGRDVKPPEALKMGLVSAVVPLEKLEAAALALLEKETPGERWRAMVKRKTEPVLLNGIERLMSFNVAKGLVAQQAGRNYPAPMEAVKAMESVAHENRDTAMAREAEAFSKLAKTPQAHALISIFQADQFLKKKAKGQTSSALKVNSAAVIGAGIMGGGIAYQSASRGTPVVLKDIKAEALEAGFGEATRLLNGQVERGRITREDMGRALSAIQGTFTYGDFAHVDVVVEAVVENAKVKKSVLAEAEAALSDTGVLCSNTSTISIDLLAADLKHPDRFCGMHFFNPVHRMPLVEVIRGKASSDQTIATVVAYAQKLGKTPIVVKDCAGFLVNRILGPYMTAFQLLVREGVPIEAIDKAMERYGWPMGPAYLSDVVGLDTAYHAGQVMGQAYPDRISPDAAESAPTSLLYKAGSLGQKNGKGYYRYEKDRRGKDKKIYDPSVMELLAPAINGGSEGMEAETIVERMMLPMIFEASRCLEESIVDSPTEVDMSLVLGLGFPPFLGGLLLYADTLGSAAIVDNAAKYSALGGLYKPTAQIEQQASGNKGFYG